mgnify:CR=1 FL=1
MDDSHYGKDRWSGGRYSLLDHIMDYATPQFLAALVVLALVVCALFL